MVQVKSLTQLNELQSMLMFQKSKSRKQWKLTFQNQKVFREISISKITVDVEATVEEPEVEAASDEVDEDIASEDAEDYQPKQSALKMLKFR